MIAYVITMTDGHNYDWICHNGQGIVLKITGFVLNTTGVGLSMTGFCSATVLNFSLYVLM